MPVKTEQYITQFFRPEKFLCLDNALDYYSILKLAEFENKGTGTWGVGAAAAPTPLDSHKMSESLGKQAKIRARLT